MAFGEYIKFFKGCSILNTKQASRTDSLQKCSEKVMSAAANIHLGRQHLLMNDSSQLMLPIIFFFLELGLREVKIPKFKYINFNNVIVPLLLCRPVFRTKACSLILSNLDFSIAIFYVLKCLTNIQEFYFTIYWLNSLGYKLL